MMATKGNLGKPWQNCLANAVFLKSDSLNECAEDGVVFWGYESHWVKPRLWGLTNGWFVREKSLFSYLSVPVAGFNRET